MKPATAETKSIMLATAEMRAICFPNRSLLMFALALQIGKFWSELLDETQRPRLNRKLCSYALFCNDVGISPVSWFIERFRKLSSSLLESFGISPDSLFDERSRSFSPVINPNPAGILPDI
ncbi:hypothetical protein DAI22_02g093850 [Oryza sativa Japonica Group]|nr:hypothetical protein DAI22_02g093850 [Oryza sativa Japonica Group]